MDTLTCTFLHDMGAEDDGPGGYHATEARKLGLDVVGEDIDGSTYALSVRGPRETIGDFYRGFYNWSMGDEHLELSAENIPSVALEGVRTRLGAPLTMLEGTRLWLPSDNGVEAFEVRYEDNLFTVYRVTKALEAEVYPDVTAEHRIGRYPFAEYVEGALRERGFVRVCG